MIAAAPPRPRRFVEPSALGGFWPALGFTFCYLSFFVLLPLAALALRPWELGVGGVWHVLTAPRTRAALELSFTSALIAACVNIVFGTIAAWSLVRYEFPGKRVLDALVDLPFALPTAVAGIALTAIYAPHGIVGQLLTPFGIKAAYTSIGIVIALIFVGFPFVVRTIQPVLEDLDPEVEEAAATLGATRWRTLTRVVFPAITPAILTGFALSFARAVGEYGSVIFIAGNIPRVSEIAPLLIVIRLDEFDYAGAAAIGLAMLTISFLLLFVLNAIQAGLLRRGAQH